MSAPAAEYMRRYRQQHPESRARQQRTANARRRALALLAQERPADYERLLAQVYRQMREEER